MKGELELDIDDYAKLLQYEGDIYGCVKLISKDTFESDIIEKYKELLSKAKSVVIEFEINKTISLFEINDYMSSLHNHCTDNTSLIFGIREKNSIENKIVFKMIISGI